MTAMPECDKVLLVQAELDGELGAAEAAALAAHRADCPICQAAAAELARARALINDAEDLHHAMPSDVRDRVIAAIADRGSREAQQSSSAASSTARGRGSRALSSWRGWWSSAAGFGLGAVCTALIAFLLVTPSQQSLSEEVVASHIRALQPGHLEDVVSSDQHTVKPWFDGRIDFAPPVKDLATDRFPLKGGRLDYLAGRAVAALVYQHDRHLIDLYVWPLQSNDQQPEIMAQQGYNVVHWTAGGMNFWAVSDVEAKQLHEFVEDWRRSP